LPTTSISFRRVRRAPPCGDDVTVGEQAETGDGTLANTGAEGADVIGAAVLLVLGGGVAVAVARGRTA